MRLKTCPVRAFTPDVESALRWFHWTHDIQVIPMVGVRYARVSWPEAGGAGEQDAWLTTALAHLCEVHNDILIEQMSDRTTQPGGSARGER